jgi:2'-5' RNA ligase
MRLFFAVWPDAEAAQSLAAVSRTLADLGAGKPVAAAKIHLTLAFLGETDAERAIEAAASIRGRAFDMVLDNVGSFRSARVAWAGCGRTPPELGALQETLDRELRRRAFALEARPFVPHVTLARRIARNVPRAPMAPIAWRARELTLVRSETGTGRYAVVERWPLV